MVLLGAPRQFAIVVDLKDSYLPGHHLTINGFEPLLAHQLCAISGKVLLLVVIETESTHPMVESEEPI